MLAGAGKVKWHSRQEYKQQQQREDAPVSLRGSVHLPRSALPPPAAAGRAHRLRCRLHRRPRLPLPRAAAAARAAAARTGAAGAAASSAALQASQQGALVLLRLFLGLRIVRLLLLICEARGAHRHQERAVGAQPRGQAARNPAASQQRPQQQQRWSKGAGGARGRTRSPEAVAGRSLAVGRRLPPRARGALAGAAAPLRRRAPPRPADQGGRGRAC